MSNNFRTDVEKVIEEADVGIISGSVYTYQSASFLVTDSGSVTQFHSPILIPVASASAMPTPLAGTGSLYVKGTDNKIYFKNDGGTEYDLTSGGGGGGGSPGGSDTQIQYNNGGSFGGVASMTFDDSSGHLTIIDDKKLQFGTGNDASIEYDEDGGDVLLINGAATKFTVAGVEIENASDSGAAALTIDNDDVDQEALSIVAANTTGGVFGITADSLTTGKAVVVYSNSNSGAERDLIRVRNDNTAADATTLLRLMNDADPDDTPEGATMVIEHNFNTNNRNNLALTSTGVTSTTCAALSLQKSTTSEADDGFLGIIRFQGMNSNNDLHEYASIVGITSDVTDGDEGGLIKLFVHAGGTAGTADFKELLNIGGEDVANGTVPSVVVNEDGINCDFRVESDGEDEAIFLDASAETLYINKGESDFTTQIHNTNDVAISVDATGVVLNEDGHATNDFRVESDNATHMLFVDSGNDRVSIGNTVDAPGAVLEVVSAANSGVPLILLDNDDTDKICLDIDAANIDADVIDITADAVTTAHVMDVTADGLTTGGILNLVSDSSDTSDRTLVKVTNDNTSATGTTIMHLKSDAITDDNPILLIESSAADTGPVLELRNTNAGTNREAILKFTRSDSSAEADDMDLGRLQFQGVDSGNSDTVYVAILAEASDITGGDEGGLLKFRLFSGGTGGTAASNTLFSIGGEDVANSTPCEVVVNEDGIDCNFRAESDNNTHMLFVDAGDDTASAGGIDATNHKDGFAVFNDFHGTTFENKLSDGQFGSGEVLRISADSSTLTSGQIYYLRTAGNWVAADADGTSEAQSNLLGVGLGGSGQTVGVLLRGFIRIPSTEILNTPTNCPGLPIYLSTTAGHFDFTAPSSSGDVVRIVGYAIDQDSSDVLVYFNPDSTFVEIA